MTIIELYELEALSIDFMFSAVEASDVVLFGSGFKLWRDITEQIRNKGKQAGELHKELRTYARRHGIA